VPETEGNGIMRIISVSTFFAFAMVLLVSCLQGCNSNGTMRTLYIPPNVQPDTIGPEYLHHVSQIKYWDRISAANRATNFAWWDANGVVHEMNEFYDKIIVLNFFGTWSAPSLSQMNILDSLEQDTNVLVLAVAMKERVRGGMAVQLLDSFARAHRIPYELLTGSSDFSYTYGGIDVVPTTFVIDVRRKITATFEGFATKTKLLDAIASAKAAQ
jgi:thiol-disulfide isomerase/thioredoxin